MAAVIGRSQLARLLEGWVAGEGALHTRLTGRLRALVWAGDLPAGTRLPSERILADTLNVSRNTVGAAFDELPPQAPISRAPRPLPMCWPNFSGFQQSAISDQPETAEMLVAES